MGIRQGLHSSKKVMSLGLVFSVFAVFLAGCSWVKPLPESSTVSVVASAEQLINCKKVGQVTTRVADKVGFFERDSEAVIANLYDLAKNEAVRMGANTLMPLSGVQDGSMRFALFQCPVKEK